MTTWQTLRRIVIPEALTVAFPSLINSFIGLIKGTSLAFTCAVVEMTAQAKILGGRDFRYFGLTIKVSGGLVKADKVRLILEVEKSLAPIKQDDDYLQRKTRSKSEIVCNLGQTAVISGQREITRTKSDSGYAFLRHVPWHKIGRASCRERV